MSSVLISQRREALSPHDDGQGHWVSIQPRTSPAKSKSPIEDALNALASGYEHSSVASASVPREDNLRPISQSDIDAVEYLDSLYTD